MLLDRLKKYAASGALPMHMPGHKRNAGAFPWLGALGCQLDITEIDGFDNLNAPKELFRDLERRAAALWGAKESICLVNGSTVGILASVRSALERGGSLLLFRGAHRSLYHAAELVGAQLQTYYIVPQMQKEFGIFGSVTPAEVERALDAHPDVRLAAITSPTYEGVISDVQGIAEVCHARGVLLLVDEAHGAHLGFGGFPLNAVRCGADLAVQSLHKTLPSLTQTAILHIGGNRAESNDLRRNAAMLQTSSPSYLLSASIDGCVDYLAGEGDAAAERWLSALRHFHLRVSNLKNLRILRSDDTDAAIFALDPSKIVISTAGSDKNGQWLMTFLRNRFSVELEMAAGSYAVAMTGMGDSEETLGRLADALLAADACCRQGDTRGDTRGDTPAEAVEFVLPERKMAAGEALISPGEFCSLPEAVGRISGEYVYAYPPGTPLLVPGEVIGGEFVKMILRGEMPSALHSTRECFPERIFCVKKTFFKS